MAVFKKYKPNQSQEIEMHKDAFDSARVKCHMEINHILSIEMLRDGGSLIVSFQSDDSCEYWIMLPIANINPRKPIFKAPILINRTTSIEVDLSYSSAQAWLNRLATFDSEQEDKELLNKMLDVVNEHT